ncbi:MAG: T9SS type A sorting domain-containing protein [Saprospiraceae bacterium]|nr:T9SS type A sorting domain-containing protein [Saprospiraceae bacterium]
MNKNVLFLLGTLMCCLPRLSAQNAADIVVPVTVTTADNPASITLSFPATANAVATLVGRKFINQSAWTFTTLPATATTYQDVSVSTGVGYEYLVIKQTSVAPTTRFGLVYAGIEVGATTYQGRMLLVVDNTLSAPLSTELARLVQDLRGDGWQVVRRDIDVASSTVSSVKTLLRTDYEANPDATVAALLFGNIPVPYSGNIAPDGHGEHQGAWATDYYYSDMDEDGWTDNLVNNNAAARPANRNIPGDGKFDQDQTPSFPELVVSRVDFSNLSGWDVSQTELYRRYLNKNHAFRTGAFKPENKTLVDDNFGYASGQAYAQSGWNNGYALTGPNSVSAADFFNGTESQSYLLGYGCGSGSYTGADGVGTSDNFKTDTVNMVFSMLFGSYFGDWDSETNPFMPSALASKGSILTSTWAGRPNWTFHQMGLGLPIWFSTYLTWVNGFLSNPMYPPNPGYDLIHVGLLGDPSLRAHAVQPPTKPDAAATCSTIALNWTASPDPEVFGYGIYWSANADSIYQLIGVTAATAFTDSFPVPGPNLYFIKAVKLEQTPTGSYYNQSIGASAALNFDPTPPTVSAAGQDISCHGGTDGAVNLTVSGGMNFTYNWSNMATTPGLSGVAAGTYTVTVTNAIGCTTTASATISEPPALSVQTMANNAVCFGASNGNISLSVIGGTPPFQFNWSNSSTEQDLENLGPNTYTVTTTDGNGCTQTASATVTQPSQLVLTSSAEDVRCNGDSNGAIDLSVSGGTPGYTYTWSNGSTTQDLNNLPAGTYTPTVTDAFGCTQQGNPITLTQPSAITAQTAVTSAGCAGATNGSVVLTVNGGAMGYTYLWSNGSMAQSLVGVAANTYTVTITDAAGCTQTSSATVQQITDLSATVSSGPVSCFGQSNGSASVVVAGGSPGYSYNWPGGQTTPDIGNLSAGTYTVTVTDAAGCSQTAVASVVQPTALLLQSTPADVSCFEGSNGSIDLSASGSTPGYTFVWSNGKTTEDISTLGVGTYTVTVSDAAGCTGTLESSISQPTALVADILQFVQTGCTGELPLLGNVSTQVSGATPPYQFNWSNGSTTTTPVLNSVPIEAYTLTVTDAKGCSTIQENISLQFYQPWQLSTTVTDVLCFGGTDGAINLSVSGAAGPNYSYKWSNGAITKNLTEIPVGIYTVTVTDETGCTSATSATVTEPVQIVVSISGQDTACMEIAQAYAIPDFFKDYTWTASNNATISVGQGTNSISVLWNTIGANTVSVDFTDGNGCPGSAQFDVFVKLCIIGTQEAGLPGVRVMPNPFTDALTVQFEQAAPAGARVRLLDVQGRLLQEQSELTPTQGLNTATLPAGTYFLQVIDKGRTGTWKLVKMD